MGAKEVGGLSSREWIWSRPEHDGSGCCFFSSEAIACDVLFCYLDELNEEFYPWMEKVLPIVASLLTFPFHAMVRMAAVSGDRQGTLNWRQRFNIILGMARGLAYLHEEFHSCIIHRDIKSSNILVDDEFQPKIADFGLARLLPGDQSHLSTKFAGTLGYTAPEYAIHGQLSERVDTYSYGVVVLEIISGLKSNDVNCEPAKQYLLEWAWNLHENDMLMDLVDEKLNRNECTRGELKKVIDIALMCTQSSVASRPTMSEVVVMLLSNSETVQEPTRPAFVDVTSRVRGETPPSTGSSPSIATVSTSLSAR